MQHQYPALEVNPTTQLIVDKPTSKVKS